MEILHISGERIYIFYWWLRFFPFPRKIKLFLVAFLLRTAQLLGWNNLWWLASTEEKQNENNDKKYIRKRPQSVEAKEM